MKPELYTENTIKVLNNAKTASEKLGHDYVGSEHLLIGLAETEGAAFFALRSFGVTAESVIPYAGSSAAFAGRKQFTDSSGYASDAKKILEFALYEAKSALCPQINTNHILLSILREDCVASNIISMLVPDVRALKEKLAGTTDAENADSVSKTKTEEAEQEQNERYTSSTGSRIIMSGERTARSAHRPETDSFCTDLTAIAKTKGFDPLIGCENELNRLIQTLLRRGKNNPVLVGKPGVGKSAIVEGLASLIAEGKIPTELKNTKLLRLDIGQLVAGTKYRGDFEDRLNELLNGVDENTILFIDEIHTIVGAGAGEGGVDAANILKPALARGDIRVIGATTFGEYRKYIEKDAALERRFSPITVTEPDREGAIRILYGIRSRYEKHHGVRFEDSALSACVDMSIRCMPERSLPDKAIDIMDEAAAYARLNPKAGRGKPDPDAEILRKQIEEALEKGDFDTASKLRDIEKQNADFIATCDRDALTVTAEDVIRVACELSGIPETVLGQSLDSRAMALEQNLNAVFYGQSEAVGAISAAIRSGLSGLSDSMRPIASLLIAGGRGTGKTTIGELLADCLYGDKSSMIRFDMSDFSDESSVNTLLGSPLGYKDSEEGGVLIESIRRKPFAVVLFDNAELACREVLGIIRRIVTEGVAQDNRGRTASFRNAIVLLTVRTVPEKAHAVGFAQPNSMATVEDSLRKLLPSDLFTAVDSVIKLKEPDRITATAIAQDGLNEIAARARRRNIVIKFNENCNEFAIKDVQPKQLAEEGAWAVRRAVSDGIESAVSKLILSGSLLPDHEYELIPDTETGLTLKPILIK